MDSNKTGKQEKTPFGIFMKSRKKRRYTYTRMVTSSGLTPMRRKMDSAAYSY